MSFVLEKERVKCDACQSLLQEGAVGVEDEATGEMVEFNAAGCLEERFTFTFYLISLTPNIVLA